MTTELEIIDTAVKIGLGAAISFIGTYCVTNIKNQHELKKISLENKLGILREIAERIEDSDNLLNDFSHSTRKNFNNNNFNIPIDFTDKLFVAHQTASKAKALANLIGLSQLALKTDEYIQAIHNLHCILINNPNIKNLISEECSGSIDIINSHLAEIAPLISEAYLRLRL